MTSVEPITTIAVATLKPVRLILPDGMSMQAFVKDCNMVENSQETPYSVTITLTLVSTGEVVMEDRGE